MTGSSVYVESVLLQKLILRSTGASLANRVGLIMTGAWLSPCTRAHMARAISHFLTSIVHFKFVFFDMIRS